MLKGSKGMLVLLRVAKIVLKIMLSKSELQKDQK